MNTSTASRTGSFRLNMNMENECVTLKEKKQNDRYRSFPCFNFLISGGCPYFERCTYIHDHRLKLERQVIRTKKNHQADSRDIFFWPDVEVDATGCYNIPKEFALSPDYHDSAIYSMWQHFNHVFAPHNNEEEQNNWKFQPEVPLSPTGIDGIFENLIEEKNCRMNAFIERGRLETFIELSAGS